MGLLSFLFKRQPLRIEDFIKRNAVILDVRTKREWDEAHLSQAIHIPLDELKHNIDNLKKLNKPIIAHCKSGVRSAKAVKILKLYGMEAVNGGGILELKQVVEP